jgi:16S rRNA (adenine1518-N6/adenine1519-N6)-dimethyltransferase
VNTVRSILNTYNISPRKRLGQSFLEDKNVIQKIVNVADIGSDDLVVEIGSGLGVMTSFLAEAARKVIAIEIDPRMTKILRERFYGDAKVEVFEGDVLFYNFTRCFTLESSHVLKVIGNIPYNISTPILFHLLQYRRHISSMVLMFQKEVSDRIVAIPGSRNYGIPSVIVAMFGVATQEMTIPASCFYPRPRVLSSVVKIDVRRAPLVDLFDEDLFFRLVKKSFAQRRKTIFNNLRYSCIAQHTAGEIMNLLNTAGIDGNCRGETLSAEQYGRLSNVFYTAIAQ